MDQILPRGLALFPYSTGLLFLRILLKLLFGPATKVWDRNSVRARTFIFGVSDLDITVLSDRELPAPELCKALKISKRFLPFLGEANVYLATDLKVLVPRMNSFELRRDPVLESVTKVARREDRIEKLIFLQRMFFSDALTLAEGPLLRQKKWRHHLELTGIEVPEGQLTTETVIQALGSLLPSRPGLSGSLRRWMKEFRSPEFDVYHAEMGEGFRILAPHLYLWFHHDREARDRELLESLLSEERALIERQIDWEIWGLYCQRSWLRATQVLEHLERLTKVRAAILPEFDEALEMEQLRALFLGPSAVLT